MKTLTQTIEEQDKMFEEIYYDYERNEFAGRPLDIEEYIKISHSRDTAILEGVAEMIEALETQKFLDKKSQVGDFVKLDDVLAIFNQEIK